VILGVGIQLDPHDDAPGRVGCICHEYCV
jgi:hypothetical protein